MGTGCAWPSCKYCRAECVGEVPSAIIVMRKEKNPPNVHFQCFSCQVLQHLAMKENMKPVNGNSQGLAEAPFGINLKEIEVDLKRKAMTSIDGKKLPVLKDALREEKEDESATDMNEAEMDCGDVVRLFAVIDGRNKEIGKGILMGLAGSKYGRKVIPKGWRSIKVTSYTFKGATEACPFLSGWVEQVKHQTIREAMGRTVLWPDTFLHSLLHT